MDYVTVLLALFLAGVAGAAAQSGEPLAAVGTFVVACIFTVGTMAKLEKGKEEHGSRAKHHSRTH